MPVSDEWAGVTEVELVGNMVSTTVKERSLVLTLRGIPAEAGTTNRGSGRMSLAGMDIAGKRAGFWWST